MEVKEVVENFLEGARVALGEAGEGPGVGFEVGRARWSPDAAWMSPELAQVYAALVRKFGRVAGASLERGPITGVGELELPGGLGVFRVVVLSSVPEEHIRTFWLPATGRGGRSLSNSVLSEVAVRLQGRPVSSRLSSEVLGQWYVEMLALAEGEARAVAADARRRMVTTQSRRVREVESVFASRLSELAESGRNGDENSLKEVVAERRRAVQQVTDHYDPERVRVRLEPLLVLWLWGRGRRRKGDIPTAVEVGS